MHERLPPQLLSQLHKSNICRWKHEPDAKYKNCTVASFIRNEVGLVSRINENPKIKKANEVVFELIDTFHKVLADVKGVKKAVRKHQPTIVNAIDSCKKILPVKKGLKIFGMGRSTFQKFKTKTITECFNSYFDVCVQAHPHQLMRSEVLKIKEYLTMPSYKHWSKASIFYVALREEAITFSLDTWYKYARLLGFGNRHLQDKEKYSPLKTTRPNEFWCADASEFKTEDGQKHYFHILIDHYSKLILGWKVTDRPSGKAIKELLQNAYEKYIPKGTDEVLKFLTDGGTENTNNLVKEYINEPDVGILQLIAQKDIKFSNSMTEAVIKVIKHQFLLPKTIKNRVHLICTIDNDFPIYNEDRPQHILKGATPIECYNGIQFDMSKITNKKAEQRLKRIEFHKNNACKKCS